MIKTNVIFMGQPGVGKGTVAAIIAEKSNLKHVSTGSIFREQIANKTELGKKVESIVTSGGYVPDDITNAIVKEAALKLNSEGKYFILDGYPRTIAQAKFLSSINGLDFVVVELTVDKEVILERLGGRRSCPSCQAGYHVKFKPSSDNVTCDNCGTDLITRKDDAPEAIIKRLDIYNSQTQPLIDYYKAKGTMHTFDASESPEKVAEKVLNLLEKNGKI